MNIATMIINRSVGDDDGDDGDGDDGQKMVP